jgi:hypothetical protein
MTLIFAGCVLAIGVVVILWRRGVFGGKVEAAPTAPANTSEPAK